MTTQELTHLAYQFEEQEYGDLNPDVHSSMKVVHGYRAGFLKALALIAARAQGDDYVAVEYLLEPFTELLP